MKDVRQLKRAGASVLIAALLVGPVGFNEASASGRFQFSGRTVSGRPLLLGPLERASSGDFAGQHGLPSSTLGVSDAPLGTGEVTEFETETLARETALGALHSETPLRLVDETRGFELAETEEGLGDVQAEIGERLEAVDFRNAGFEEQRGAADDVHAILLGNRGASLPSLGLSGAVPVSANFMAGGDRDQLDEVAPDAKTEALRAEVDALRPLIEDYRREMGRVIIGMPEVADALMRNLLAGGNLLLEGIPGLAKTLAAKTFAKTLDLKFSRIQFTPDLLPQDITGHEDKVRGKWTVKRGPVFGNVILADEVNRAPGKTQAAMLEAMEERQVTIAGERYPLEGPVMFVGTQNPLEQEGVFPLPEAKLDRIAEKIILTPPDVEELNRIMRLHKRKDAVPEVKKVLGTEEIFRLQELVDRIRITPAVEDYIARLIFATRKDQWEKNDLDKDLRAEVSPRAAQAFHNAARAYAFMNGRHYVVPKDVRDLAANILRHRIRLSFEAEAQGKTPEDVIKHLLTKVPSPS